MYISWMNDPELSYVQALKLNVIPQHPADPILKLSLDVLPTVVGHRGKMIPLSPVTLLRGVVGELAEQLDLRSEEEALAEGGALSRLWALKRHRRARQEALACVRELDALAARVDLMQPDFAQLSAWVFEMTAGKPTPLIPLRLIVALLCVALALYMAAQSLLPS